MKKKMKIATYNANSIRSRIELLKAWLGKHKPDILCVQETKVQDDEFPLEAFRDTRYEVVFRGQKKYNGVAIFSRFPLEEIEVDLPNDPVQEARFLKAKAGKIIVLNTYIPQGQEVDSDKFQYKLEYFRLLKSYFSSRFDPQRDFVLWCGDLNAAREPIDVYDPEGLWGHVCYCKEVKESFEDVMKWGFIDLFRQFHPEGGHYTFWDYRIPNSFQRKLGWRLDYILATEPLAKTCQDCWIDLEARRAEKPSDHTFLVAEFAL
ncbi:MAG TPA: exodeoxyribonuclease III [Anaerohalosphaeraceae bacterium]|nr:exodeoxyribonuclease III [Anaerohalosphaeraceae bacterium]